MSQLLFQVFWPEQQTTCQKKKKFPLTNRSKLDYREKRRCLRHLKVEMPIGYPSGDGE